MIDYTTLVNNVNNFYTDGSAAIDYLNSQQLTIEEMGKVIDASDRFNVVRNTNGEIINFTQRVTTSTSSGGVASGLNSNAAEVAKTTVDIPLKTSVNSAGKVTLTQGLANAGRFLTTEVAPAMAAAGAGIALGKWIDSSLYNLNPDFWDANGMNTLNPETWGSITAGSDSISSNLFNMIFSIDPATGVAQPYIDQNALAYITGYMMQQGVFDAPHVIREATISGFSVTAYEAITSANNPHVYNVTSNGVEGYIYYFNTALKWGITTFEGSKVLVAATPTRSWDFEVIPSQSEPGGGAYVRITTDREYTFNNDVAYFDTYPIPEVDPWTFSNYCSISPASDTYAEGDGATAVGRFAWSLLYGDATEESLEGVVDQPNATPFDPSGISDPANLPEILSALQAQFPQLFEDALTQPLPQIDPAPATDPIYIPIGMPQLNPLNPTQPTANIATQNDPAPLPDILPEGALNELTNQIVDPDGNPNPPGTGIGSTPAIIPPTGSANALWGIYNPTQAQVDAFGAWLWSSDFVDQLKKIFNDPMESIISLHKVFGTPVTGGSGTIAVGYLDSGVSSAIVTNQYTNVDCGEVQLNEYFGNVYDYQHTTIELYLPFVGIVPLSVSDVMRANIHIVYHIDVLTGACLVDVIVTRDAGAGGVLYQYSGDCAVHYPVSSGSYIGIVGSLLSAGAGIAGTIATGGAAMPLLLGTASALTHAHTDVARSGGFTANAGAMGAKIPYLIISRPQTALPEKYAEMEGVGSNKYVTLQTCTGYVTIKAVQLTGIPALDTELNVIESLLKEGVII